MGKMRQEYDTEVTSTFKSVEETQDKKNIYVTIVTGLILVAFVAPMVAFFLLHWRRVVTRMPFLPRLKWLAAPFSFSAKTDTQLSTACTVGSPWNVVLFVAMYLRYRSILMHQSIQYYTTRVANHFLGYQLNVAGKWYNCKNNE